MRNIHCLNNISAYGTDLLTDDYQLVDDLTQAEGVLVRSAALHDTAFPESLQAIARAGAGVNNIPLDRCAEEGIVVFNTPGANANAVKEIVVCGLMLGSRDIAGGIAWCRHNAADENIAKAAEKAKKAFAGREVKGKKLGVIGLGAIGAEVANIAIDLGMDVYGYDPYVSVGAAWSGNTRLPSASSGVRPPPAPFTRMRRSSVGHASATRSHTSAMSPSDVAMTALTDAPFRRYSRSCSLSMKVAGTMTAPSFASAVATNQNW